MNYLKFSFLENVSFLIQDLLVNTFSGIEKVDLIYYDAKEVLMFRRARRQGSSIEYDDSQRTILVDRKFTLVNEKRTPHWLKENDLPYSLHKNVVSQPTLDDEFNVKILFITLQNYMTNKVDYFYIFLKNRANSFGIKKENKNITISDLEIFSYTLENFISSVQKNSMNDRGVLNTLIKGADSKNLKLKELENSVILEKERIRDLYRQIVVEELNKLEKETGKKIQVSDSVINVFDQRSIPIPTLRTVLKNAVIQVINLSVNDGIQINDTDIFLPDESDEDHDRIVGKVGKPANILRENKVKVFLNSLEEIVAKQINNSRSTTSKAVGELCVPTLTPPAIRDKLLKNKKTVQRIIHSDAKGFQNIALYFKPVMRIMEEDQQQD